MNRIKFTVSLALMFICSLNIQAQEVPIPTADLYDTEMMTTYLQTLAETKDIREKVYDQYVELAFIAAKNQHWSYVVNFVTSALNTGFWNADLYYLRGIAYEHLGLLKYAKRDFKKGKRKGSEYAANALERLKSTKKK